MDQPTDGALLAALKRGDQAALTELVSRHQRVLLGHARALLGEGGAYEDVVQDVFLRLLKRPPEMPPQVAGDVAAERAHLAAWLHKVTRNCCMDTMRAEARRKGREREVAAPETARDEQGSGVGLVELTDTRAAVERGLKRLPPEQREVLVLRLLGERSYKEIAEITGKKIGTVGWLISEGLRSLSVSLAPLVEGAGAPVAVRTDGVSSNDVSRAGGVR